MDTRLVVGCGSIGHALVTELTDRPGDLLVLDDSDRRIQRLREDGVTAKQTDVTDPDALRGQAGTVTSVVLAADRPAANLAAAEAAREAFPDAMLLGYAGTEPDQDELARLRSLVDRVVDPGEATTDFLMSRVSDEGFRFRQLRKALRDLSEPLAIVMHDNPDPDAIASAAALQRIADAFGVESEICYYGEITHQENRAFVNLLGFDLTGLDPDADLDSYGGFALVDHSRPGVNDQLPPDTPIDIVIDHHPPRAPVDAKFVDLRSSVGATSTLLVQHLQSFGVSIDETVATGLLFGIRVDTGDFTREVSPDDFQAAAAIIPRADFGTLDRIESPSVSGDTFETIANAIRNRRRRGSILTSCVGDLPDRDVLAQAADRLLDLEGVNATIVYGVKDGVIYISGRARGTDLDLGETLRDAFDQIGSAGGHADMAGAQIQVADTALESSADERGDGADAVESDGQACDTAATDLSVDLETFISERFFEALRSRPRRETTGLYTGAFAPGDTEW